VREAALNDLDTAAAVFGKSFAQTPLPNFTDLEHAALPHAALSRRIGISEEFPSAVRVMMIVNIDRVNRAFEKKTESV